MEYSYEDKLLVRNAYAQAIRERWHPDPECSILREDFDKDVHVGGEAPGNWAPRSLVEIYCECGRITEHDDCGNCLEHDYYL